MDVEVSRLGTLLNSKAHSINHVLQLLRKRWRWARYERTLDKIATVTEFQELVRAVQDPAFQVYEHWDAFTKHDLACFLDATSLKVEGRRFLDVGPGYGAALDVAKQRGASSTDFVDYDPFVCAFNRLKGHRGVRLDIRRNLGRMAARQYDFVWSKATFTADRFNESKTGWLQRFKLYPDFETLLSDLERLVVPGGTSVFCPHWHYENGQRKIGDVMKTRVAEILLREGYTSLPSIEGHNFEPMCPTTFIKNVTA